MRDLWASVFEPGIPLIAPLLGFLAYLIAKGFDYIAQRARTRIEAYRVEQQRVQASTQELIRGLENRVKGLTEDLDRATKCKKRLEQENRELKREIMELERLAGGRE